MLTIILFVKLLAISLLPNVQKAENEPLLLRYNKPAANWDEALPIGNGNSGAMVFGGIDKEQLSLNENTLYSGGPTILFNDIEIEDHDLEEVVSLLKKGEYIQPYDIISKKWLGRLHQYYQPFGDLFIEDNTPGVVTKYERTLDISNSVTTTSYYKNGKKYSRETFASHPDNIIVVKLTSESAEGIDVTLRFGSPHPTAAPSVENNRLILSGKAPGYVERRTFEQIESWGDEHKHPEIYDDKGNRKFDKRVLYGDEIDNHGMMFEAQLLPVFNQKGNIESTDSTLRVFDTNEVYFILALATSFNGYDKCPMKEGIHPTEKIESLINNVLERDYNALKNRHTLDYKSLFNRVSLTLSSTDEQKTLPTDERIMRFAEKGDPDLAALLFQYGRYLMISGSRQGGQPLNLQGIWNKDIIPAWNSGYTQNINTQMNYWPTESTNLTECNEPLFTMIKELAESGAETAQKMYKRRGWVAHHNTSIWRESVPNDNVPSASFWPMAQGWYSSHLWEHYAFTNDEGFLRKTAYPLMKGAAEFYLDWLVKTEDGYWVTPVGISPENRFYTPQRQVATISMGPTMDMAIIRELFGRMIEASKILHINEPFLDELKEKYTHLLPYKIGQKGQLQEWMYDFEEVEPTHRHLSHLYGFHPGNQITPDTSPEVFEAVRQSLLLRGDEASGWSMGWKINCWARMLDGNHAYKIIKNLFNPVGFGNGRKGGGLFRNMLDAHPPFQIDGNFGYTSGVAEMLLQSHAGFIQLLPALPGNWADGAIRGLKARGNFEVSFSWKDKALTEATIVSISGSPCKIRTSHPVVVKKGDKEIATSKCITSNKRVFYEVCFPTKIDESFTLSPI